MPTKRQLLANFCHEVVEKHRPSLNVETRFRRAVAPDTSRRDRVRVMGDPTFYLEVLSTGARESTVNVAGGAAIQYLHTFQVSLFFAYDDDEVYGLSSQQTWDAMIESTDDAFPGLLIAVDQTVVLGTGDNRCSFDQAQEVTDDVVPLDMQSTEAAHMLTFLVDIEG